MRNTSKTGSGKKNNKSEHWEQLSVVVHERKRLGKETEVFIRGELQSRDKIRKEISRYHPPIQQRLSFSTLLSALLIKNVVS